ncbi:hypothetical protein DH86_00002302 [Scytalidium sp. 3C]|nr:hypothetical protein DH86_00002302 [Scytalidium sp. 3C]
MSSVLETISPKVTDSKHGEAFGTNISTDLDPAKGPDSSSVTETNSLPSVSTTPPPQDVQATSTLHESTSDVVDGQNSNRPASESSEATSQVSTKAQEGTNIQKVKSSAASTAPAASPTPQESFFKAVSRRLQLLEANSTLSLQYIEEQSRILREAFSKVEKKQLQKTTTFLEILNNTVLAELQVFRQQYDEIWQATVISLDSQRAESQREILAISARLNILADEVVFQKRRIQEHLDEPSLRVENLDHAPLTPISTYSGSERGGSPMVIDESIPRVEEPAHNDSSVLMAGSLMPNSHRRSFSGWHDVADSSVNLPEFRISQSQEDEFLNQTMNLDVTASRDHMGDGSEELCGPETAHRTLHKPLPALPPDSS